MLVLDKVCKTYHGRALTRRVLHRVDLSVARGEALAVLGGNGAGKSTLMRLIAGVEHPDSGRIDRGGLFGVLAYRILALLSGQSDRG